MKGREWFGWVEGRKKGEVGGKVVGGVEMEGEVGNRKATVGKSLVPQILKKWWLAYGWQLTEKTALSC